MIMTTHRPPLVILGCGYVGRFLFSRASAQGKSVLATHRGTHRYTPDHPASAHRLFDLARPETWDQIPQGADLIWCFPAVPIGLVQQFAARLRASTCRLVVLGSTSAYDLPNSAGDYPPPWIDESSPLDLTKPRVQGEEYLRKELGAIMLRVAGIYGPGRNPLDWIRTGRVGPSRKFVNLIHVEDLADVCLMALDHGKPGEAYNVSDGTPRTWDEICRFVQQHCGINPSTSNARMESGKRISNGQLSRVLGVTMLHPDLYAELLHL
jgi:nucleoside-diphosphate-sugar epimerase